MIDHDVRTFHRAIRPPAPGRGALLPLAVIALLLALLLAGCGGGSAQSDDEPADITIESLWRAYGVETFDRNRVHQYYGPSTTGLKSLVGLVSQFYSADLNPGLTGGVEDNPDLLTRRPGETGRHAEIYSNDDGSTYWLSAQSPIPSADNKGAIETKSTLNFAYLYRKDRPDATLTMVVTAILLEGLSYLNPDAITDAYCAPIHAMGYITCYVGLDAVHAAMTVRVADEAGRTLRRYHSSAQLMGGMQSWSGNAFAEDEPIWTEADMSFDGDAPNAKASNVSGTHAVYQLKAPIELDIPLAQVPERFWVHVSVQVSARDQYVNEEPYRAAYFRDPRKPDAPANLPRLLGKGLTAMAVTGPPPDEPPVAPCTSTADPDAGVLQFEAVDLHAVEAGLNEVPLRITRTGGTKGEVSVEVASIAGTASASTDFAPVATTVRFADGQGGTRTVAVAVLDDDQAEADETFRLQLGSVGGCASVGAAREATVTIHDADQARYTLGGTVTGLVGSGLFVRSNGFDVRVDASGPFTLAGTFASGTVYDLQIEAQPGSPPQVCRVTHGQGTIANANVTDLAVACDPPAPPPAGGALDPAFAGGLVSNPSYGRILSMALQPDGRLVVLTDFNKLLRYQVDGTLDASFGSGGVVNATLGGSALDLLRAVALQADGGILVAGVARASGGSTTGDDMGVKRYLPGGTVDTAFGTAGFVRVDIAGLSDDAVAVAVQPDGRIVLGGTALVTAIGATDFALARLQAHGALDAGFGSGGKLTVNLGGAFDSAAALALQADGAIVLVGRTATSGAATPDTGVARVSASGVVELALKLPLTAHWDEATGVAVQPDGRIVLTLEARPDAAGLYQHALARLKPDGTLDESFGTLGVALAGFSVGGDHARAPVLLADGRIATAGFARNQVQQLSDKDDVLITRHLADGTLDASFGNGGKLVIDFYGAADGASALLLQPDGKLVAGGLARSGTANGLGLVRLLP